MQLRAPGSASDKPVSPNHQTEAPTTSLGEPTTSLAALRTCLLAPATSLGAPRIDVEQSGKNNIMSGNAAGAPRNHSYYNDF